MRETTMMRNSKYIAMALGVAVLLAGCSAKSPTAPKPTPAAGFTISLTPQSSTAKTGDYVLVVAQVNSGSGNAPDGTAVTFLVSGGHFDAVDGTGSYATQVIRTTSGGRASVSVTSSSVGQALLEGRVPGNSAQTIVSFGVGPTPPPGKITITSVIPNQGGPEGGDRVVITGSGFIEPLQVAFVVDGQPFLADVVFVAAGGTSMTVVTPRVVSSPPSTVDQVADVAVQSGPNTAVLKGGFTYLAAIATPEIYVLSPNAGPFEGGTRVTITGKGFQTPVQVTFDDIQAQVVASNYTEVVCISPSITPTAPDTVITKQVTVTNIKSGKASNSLGFRYGVTMFISSFSPMEGPADTATTVTIFGQGFVAPVTVVATAGGLYQWDVLSVAGTEIVARSKPLPESARTCGDVPATLTVTNVNSNTTATATNPFTYRAIRPLITSVSIDGTGNSVTQYLPGTCNLTWASHTVTIRGTGFQSGMLARFGSVGPVITTFVDANTLTLRLPDLTGIGLNSIPCDDGGGAGSRFVPTPVEVTVINPRNSCENTLGGAIILNPCIITCQILPAPTVASVLPNQGSINGFTSVGITGANFVNSGLSVTIGGAAATGVVFLNSTSIQATTPPHTPAGPVAVTVTCGGQTGTNGSAFTYTATLNASVVPSGSGGVTGTGVQTTAFGSLTATPTAPATFASWSGACSSCGTNVSCPNVPMTTDPTTCTATFNPGLTVTLAGTIGSNTVSSSPAGISACAATCSAPFSNGASVTLTATASGTWSGDCSGTGTSASVTMNGNKNCTITFP